MRTFPSTRTTRPAQHRRHGRVAAATATLATAVAAPVLMAAPAEAASDTTWNRLAECESSKNWDINTGNGYYGGLQFSGDTWDAYGGDHWADRADQATRAEQVHMAEKVLDGQGWGAWPACSEELGLDGDDARGEPNSDPNDDRDGRD